MAELLQKEKNKETSVAKRRHAWPIAVAVVLVAALAAGLFVGGKNGGVIISPTETALLVRTDLEDTVSATGTVESAHSMTVYSTMAYTVQEVLVEVGDRVEEGQLLCKLDDQNIRDQIETQQAGLEASTAASNASINAAQDNYQQFKNNLEKGLNASIISAENAVTNAYNAYVSAQNNYERYLAGLQAGENTTLLAQESALRNARNGVENAYDAHEKALDGVETAEDALDDLEDALRQAKSARRQAADAMDAYQAQLEDLNDQLTVLEREETDLQQKIEAEQDEAAKAQLQSALQKVQGDLSTKNGEKMLLQLQGAQVESAYGAAQSAYLQAQAALSQGEQAVELAESQVETCANAITTAEEAYETTLKQYNAALTSVDNALADYAKNVETAFAAYETAKTSLEATKTSAQNQLEVYKNNLNSAYAGANKGTTEATLRQLQADLEGTEITAPMAGTVTAVYAEVGSAGSGLLFVIEDTENFVISTSVKDYDIAVVGEGTPVTIRSDATGDDVYDGTVTYIAPTANKTAMGTTDTSGDISFAADVAVNSRDTRLRIGLTVRMNLIVAQEKNVLSVPYDAIYTNAQGDSCLLMADKQSDGTWLLREQVVECGLETDLDVAVKADGLTDGMTVISEPEKYLQYVGQPVTIGTGGNVSTLEAMRQEMMGGS